MLRKSVSLILAAILILFTLTSCSKNTGSDKALVYPVDSEPASLDSQIASGKTAKIVVNNCFEGLVRLGANGKLVPGVALYWDISSNGLEYTFHLRSDAKWHLIKTFSEILGEDYLKSFHNSVTAHDFVFAFRRALSPQTNAPDASSLFIIKNAEKVHSGALAANTLGVEAQDEYTLKITLNRSSSDFLNLLISPVCMPCNETFFNATKGQYGLDVEYLLCNGPFYLSKWVHDSSLFIRKNTDYTGNDTVSPSSVTLSINPDTSTRLQKLQQGVYSAAPVTGDSVAALNKDSGITLTEYSNITWSLCFNCSDSSLSNTNIRLALCKAINRGSLNLNIKKLDKTDYLIPACCTIGQTPFRELAKGGEPVQFDAGKAKELWSKGLNNLGESEISMTLICPQQQENAMRGLLQQWQKAFGLSMDITIEALDNTKLLDKVAKGDYQIALAPVQAETSSASEFLQSFTTGNAGNIFSYRSQTYDQILKQLKSVNNATDEVAGCRHAEAHLLQNGVVYPLFSQSSYFAQAKGVSDIYPYPACENVSFLLGKAKE